jgi:hypothetical protein
MIVPIILSAVIVIQAIIHFTERRDMMNRLMSKSFTEYKNADNIPPKPIPSAHSRILNKWRSKAGDE